MSTTHEIRSRSSLRIINLRKKKKHVRHFTSLMHGLRCYCANTSLHGLQYVLDSDLHLVERCVWIILFSVSIIFATIVIYSLAAGYQAAPTSISIENMNQKVSSLPFPSVTLCLNDRVDWNRALELEKRIFPNDTNNTSLETFRKMLVKLSMISFGDFDELSFLKNENIHGLEDINVSKMLREVMPRCKDLLSSCWWHNSDRNCCEIFEVQRTEYGFCYSFNSEVADRESTLTNATNVRRGKREQRPRKASGYGDWSGIKVTIHLGNVTKPPDSAEYGGVILMMNEPHVWPNSGTMMPSGSITSVSLNCISGFATQRVLELDKSRMPCRYDETGVYNQETCLSMCKRDYVIESCGCNPSFLFPSIARYRECTIQDLSCLIDNNDLFNDYIIHFEDKVARSTPVMICNCPPECDYYLCDSQFSNVPLPAVNDIMLDVHYIGQTSFRYKTDIVITQQDLLVSFGGIISLFLGGSLLSAAEIVYYALVYLFSSLYSRWRAKESRTRPKTTTNHTITVRPLLDYGPVKPPLWKIPISTSYGTAKWNLNRY